MTAALAAPVVSKTLHFALHHLRTPAPPVVTELSTDHAPERNDSVDNVPLPAVTGLGLVVPRRLARRAVTRNLIRRQMRVAAAREALEGGAWVLRLRAPFETRHFPSAASEALREAVRGELGQLFARRRAP